MLRTLCALITWHQMLKEGKQVRPYKCFYRLKSVSCVMMLIRWPLCVLTQCTCWVHQWQGNPAPTSHSPGPSSAVCQQSFSLLCFLSEPFSLSFILLQSLPFTSPQHLFFFHLVFCHCLFCSFPFPAFLSESSPGLLFSLSWLGPFSYSDPSSSLTGIFLWPLLPLFVIFPIIPSSTFFFFSPVPSLFFSSLIFIIGKTAGES